MTSELQYAVVTGDLVGSSAVAHNDRSRLIETLNAAFQSLTELPRLPSDFVASEFEIYRGDSFQGVLKYPELALRALVALRATLRSRNGTSRESLWDARLAVGIGDISYFSGKTAEGDGEAFRRSGPLLDQLKGDRRTAVLTPWQEVNDELSVECALFDTIANRWSSHQSEVILLSQQGFTQQSIADKLGITQGAVNHRLKAGNWSAVEIFIDRFESLIRKQLKPTA